MYVCWVTIHFNTPVCRVLPPDCPSVLPLRPVRVCVRAYAGPQLPVSDLRASSRSHSFTSLSFSNKLLIQQTPIPLLSSSLVFLSFSSSHFILLPFLLSHLPFFFLLPGPPSFLFSPSSSSLLSLHLTLSFFFFSSFSSSFLPFLLLHLPSFFFDSLLPFF